MRTRRTGSSRHSMLRLQRCGPGLLLAALSSAASVAQDAPPAAVAAKAPAPAVAVVAPGIEVLAGAFEPGSQPDGNSVLLEAPEGWILVDTGRHAAHQEALLERIARSGRPLVAVVNTHWHLDHVGGNPRFRQSFPQARVHASRAIEGALGGFLAAYRSYMEQALARPDLDAGTAAQFRAELAILAAGSALGPDEPVTAPVSRSIGGRPLRLELVGPAATAGDVWLFDEATRTLIAGDLVTLPVPFLDTACAAGWRTALDALGATDFARLVPGHGPVLDRAGFDRYRSAYGRLLDCAARPEATKAVCAQGWIDGLGPLLPESGRAFARELLDYYVDEALRADPKQIAARCGARLPG